MPAQLTGNQTFDTILEYAGGVAALLNVAGIIAMVWFKTQYEKIINAHKHQLDVQLAAHEATLKAKHDAEIQRLQHDLQQKQTEHQLMFSTVYEKREELLRELYSKLTSATKTAIEATHANCTPAKRQKAASDMRELTVEMEKVAIYFTGEFCDKWSKAVHAVARAIDDYDYLHATKSEKPLEDVPRAMKIAERALAAFDEVNVTLKNEIRALIGVR